MNKFYTRRTANILNIAGWVFTLASWPLPRPWSALAAVIGILAFTIVTAIRFYLLGQESGRREALKLEINRVWSEQMPFNVTEASK
jgi:hypothetical protein